jgi:hypothetical protein
MLICCSLSYRRPVVALGPGDGDAALRFRLFFSHLVHSTLECRASEAHVALHLRHHGCPWWSAVCIQRLQPSLLCCLVRPASASPLSPLVAEPKGGVLSRSKHASYLQGLRGARPCSCRGVLQRDCERTDYQRQGLYAPSPCHWQCMFPGQRAPSLTLSAVSVHGYRWMRVNIAPALGPWLPPPRSSRDEAMWCTSVCVCVYMWWYSQEPTYSGPYPPTFQVPKVNSLVNDTVALSEPLIDSSSIRHCP